MDYILRGKVEGGKLCFINSEKYHKILNSFTGKPIEIVFRSIRTPRSGQQNKAYWKTIVELLANELGYSKDDIHYALRDKFLSTKEGQLSIPRSTTDLSTTEFNQFMADIRQWAAEFLNINIPEPGEVE